MASFSTPKKHKIIALHGFLGKSEDWNCFGAITQPLSLKNEHLPFWAWAAEFNKAIPEKQSKNILLGYSLGGRLAMHLLLESPHLWAGAILISAHPGLRSQAEKEKRMENDLHWADRFLKDPWDDLLRDWNQNPIFNKAPFPSQRIESEFNRRTLSLQLKNWSLGRQENLLPQLQQLPFPLLILAGEKDEKFASLSSEFTSFADVKIIEGASHRLPWEASIQFESILQKFIQELP